jgi:tricorn protease
MKLKPILASLCLLAAWNIQAAEAPRFASYPTLSPDGKTVFFCFEGDIWQTPTIGGSATRVTALPGEEIQPKVSPDGKYLAFSSNQFGNYDVFVLPLGGGDIRQLTFHDANDEMDSWSWDSQKIYFTSGRYNRFGSYSVSLQGGTAERLFGHYFNTTHHVVETPNGELLFNNSWESYTAAHRKRYKGAFNPDILGYHPQTKQFTQYTDYDGKDFWSSVDKQGHMYFASDETNGEYNLFTIINGKKTALTQFNTSIKRPFVSASGQYVVFEKDYQLHLYDVASKKTSLLSFSVNRNTILEKTQEHQVKEQISYFDVSPDGKKMAFIARGTVFVSDVDGKFIRQIVHSSERAFEVKWLKDNVTLLFNQTYEGYPNWYTVKADGTEKPIAITQERRSNHDLAIHPDRTQAVYLSGRDELRMLDLKSLKSKLIVKDEFWAFQNSKPSFSPDGNFVLFTAYRNFEQDILVYDLKKSSTIQLTKTGVSEVEPIWSPDGQYIIFASNRLKPSYPFGMQDARIYRMALDFYKEPSQQQYFDALFEETKKADSSEQKKPIIINTVDLRSRIESISPSFGSQFSPKVYKKGDKTYVYFASNHEGGRMAWYRTILQPFESNKTEKVTDGNVGQLVEAAGKLFVLTRGTVHKYQVEDNRMTPISMNYTFASHLKGEFEQMFYETWAGLEENFYATDFHGVNWKKVRDTYATYLPAINNRNDLRILLNDMLGELNSSHLGFSSVGAEERRPIQSVTNEFGILYENKDPYVIHRIVRRSEADKTEIDLLPGDRLVAVNGQRIDPTKDRDAYFTKPTLANEWTLTFSRKDKEFQLRIRPQSSGALRNQLYDEWILHNRHRVDSLSNNKIAYSHMKNMSTGELETFLLDMIEQENNKEAIILDLRYNTGGNVHDEVLKFLSQRPYLQWQYRGGAKSPQSNFAPAAKKIVLLINEQSLSDAEMTSAGFKALGLGTIIGTETYRWIIFTSSKSLVDGSNYRVPAWGCYTLEGDNLELTGVAPDIFVKNTFEDLINARDPQLERAVKEILK